MIAYLAEVLALWDVLDINPEFLIEEENEHVVQKWYVLAFAFVVVPATSYYQALIYGQVAHGVACSSAWWDTLLPYRCEVCSHYFVAFECLELEQAQFVL